MLDAIGAKSIDDLFDEIPAELKIDALDGVPDAMSEMQISRLMRERAAMDGAALCFIGAGAYEHHIPQAVWDIATRGEYYSAYTPYQAEASQGTLQTIYEYQSMITELTGLDVSNASLYDGASGLAEAALMAVRSNRKVKTRSLLLAPGVSRTYASVAKAIAGSQGLTFDFLPMDNGSGNVDFGALDDAAEPVAVVIQQPTFLGTLEDVDRLTDWAHARNAYVIALFRLHDLQDAARPANARAYHRPHHRPRRKIWIHPDPAGAGTAHPAFQGDLEYLHQPGSDGDGSNDLHVLARPRWPGGRRAQVGSEHGAARRGAYVHRWHRSPG
jgi:glycine dehydrogenase subunit 1